MEEKSLLITDPAMKTKSEISLINELMTHRVKPVLKRTSGWFSREVVEITKSLNLNNSRNKPCKFTIHKKYTLGNDDKKTTAGFSLPAVLVVTTSDLTSFLNRPLSMYRRRIGVADF